MLVLANQALAFRALTALDRVETYKALSFVNCPTKWNDGHLTGYDMLPRIAISTVPLSINTMRAIYRC